MGQTFKAAVAMPNGTIEIQNFQTPDPKPDAGLLKVAVTGVCGSDWMFFQDFPKLQGPAILEQPDTTVWLEPGFEGRVDKLGNLLVERNA